MIARRAGFTLIEVLVALVIVALAAAAAMEAISGASDETVILRDRSFAQWIALNRIAEQRLEAARPANGDTRGVVEYAGRRWQFKQTIGPTELGLPGIRQIEVSVRLVPESGASLGPDDDQGYLVTVASGLGASVALPRGDEPDWEPAPAAGPGSPNAPGGPNNAAPNSARPTGPAAPGGGAN
jgi:general secretion pathway protein I